MPPSLQRTKVAWNRDEVSAWSPHHESGQEYMCWGSDAPFRGLWDVYGSALGYQIDFLVDAGQRRLSYAQVLTNARALMHAFETELGLKPLDRVVVIGRNSIEWITAFIAASWAGMTVVPMNSWWTGPEIEYGLLDSQSVVVFADQERMDRIEATRGKGTLNGIRFIRMERASGQSQSDFDALVSRHLPEAPGVELGQPKGVAVDSACMIMYTSGTTGHPKGVVLTHRSLCHTLNYYAFTGKRAQSKRSSEDGQICVLLCVPLFHATGLVGVLLTSFAQARKIVLMYKWDVNVALEVIQGERVSMITAVPTMIIELLNSPRLPEFNTSSLRNIGGGGAPVPAGVAKSIVKTFSKASPGQAFGLTETSAVCTVISSNKYLARPTSCGQPLPGVEIEIWPESGRGKLAPGVDGRVMVRGPNVMREYWRQPEATKKAITFDGFFDSGDIGRMDSEGFLYITDRAKDMIIRGGENISCRAVEEAVYAKLAGEVAECAVFGFPDPVLGEKVGLAMQLKPGAPKPTLAKIRSALKGVLAAYELPSGLAIFPSQLPRGGTGKLLKTAIRDMHRQGQLPFWEEEAKAGARL